MKKLNVTEGDRIESGHIDKIKSFESFGEKNLKYRKGLVLLSVFSIIYNLAGIKLTGTSIGLISGSVSFPSVLVVAILVSLIYYQILYYLFILTKYEVYLLSITNKKLINSFLKDLVQYLIKTSVRRRLESKKGLGFLRLEIDDVRTTYEKQTFSVFCNIDFFDQESRNRILEEIKSLGYNAEIISPDTRFASTESNSERIDFRWYYEKSKEDESFIERYFKSIRFYNLTVFVEYRVPFYLSIVALTTFCLRSETIMEKLHILNNYFF